MPKLSNCKISYTSLASTLFLRDYEGPGLGLRIEAVTSLHPTIAIFDIHGRGLLRPYTIIWMAGRRNRGFYMIDARAAGAACFGPKLVSPRRLIHDL